MTEKHCTNSAGCECERLNKGFPKRLEQWRLRCVFWENKRPAETVHIDALKADAELQRDLAQKELRELENAKPIEIDWIRIISWAFRVAMIGALVWALAGMYRLYQIGAMQ